MHVPSNKEEPVSQHDLARTGDVEDAFYMAHVTDFGQLEDPHGKHQPHVFAHFFRCNWSPHKILTSSKIFFSIFVSIVRQHLNSFAVKKTKKLFSMRLGVGPAGTNVPP